MLVRDRMSSPAVVARPDTSFQQALALMQEHGIRRLPVVDAEQRLIGIVAQRDLLVAALRFLTSRVDVTEVMARNVVTVMPNTTLTDVARTMLERKIGGLPVIDNGRLVGMITESDLFRAFVELHVDRDDDPPMPVKVDWTRQSHGPGVKVVE
jgi:acetoin utilization protein AcuB